MENYYKLMSTGIYNVFVDRMALYTEHNANEYVYSRRINNEGDYIETNNDTVEMIETAMTIVQMVIANKKGYSITLLNPNSVKEIIELTYNHITQCLKFERERPLEKSPVDKQDLIDMEDFLSAILENNPKLVETLVHHSMLKHMEERGTISIFNNDNVNTPKVLKENVLRRVSGESMIDLDINDILNNV